MRLYLHCEEAIEPMCPHFGQCGGCKAQHIPYDEQVAQKEAFIRTLFGRKTEPILPCEPPWNYRNKMEFSFSQDRRGEKFLGLMRKRGRVENLHACYLTSPWFIEVLERVRAWWEEIDLPAYHPPTNSGVLRTLMLREGIHTKEKMVILTISGSLSDSYTQSLSEAVGEVNALILRNQITARKTPTRFEETVVKGKEAIFEKMHDQTGHSFTFRIRAGSFFQPNTIQAEALYQCALEGADLSSEEILYDLYCGTGTLGIFASKLVKQVLGVEIVPEAVEDAQENLKLNNINNMKILKGDVGKIEIRDRPTTVIVDPPRAGLDPKAMHYLLKLAPQKIVYISCNPVSQAENCRQLEEAGYRISHLVPVDQFPHTPHVENIAFLYF